MFQQVILDRMVKITPVEGRIYEMLKYNNHWHRYDGKVTERHDKSLCGEVFLKTNETDYICANIEEFRDLEFCPDCLTIWHEKIEEIFETNQMLGHFQLRLSEENSEFLKLFIENEGYDRLNEIVNKLLYHHLRENNLLDKLRNKMSQRQN
ncbi:hypothetical protein [Robertmurraya sp. FSL R5-0851]|uniref:hypothetical protein n=1 Tax=Robertmurraya sp. FSL R5-0851 TaxID=2921584 RepID=UPI0030FB6693